jgi:hypothetical protein
MQRVVRPDYAANAGSGKGGMEYPIYDANGEITGYEYKLPAISYTVIDLPTTWWPSEKDQTGINFWGAEISLREIVDGTTKVYMVGEKYVNPDAYDSDGNIDEGDNHSSYQGFDWDINRWATKAWPPRQDQPGFKFYQGFGSAHPGGWHVVFCDGSVQNMPYDIEYLVHMRLANRLDNDATEEELDK